VLVFTRRRGEAIMIGDGIEVQVLRVGRDGVRLGVVAPAEVPVHRQEIYAQIREANRTAVNPLPDLEALGRRLQRPSTGAQDAVSSVERRP
jgi:carbon storage regulator